MTEILKSNLRLLDGDLPIIWEETLKINELHPTRTLNQLVDSLKEINPCGYNSSLAFSSISSAFINKTIQRVSVIIINKKTLCTAHPKIVSFLYYVF